jgi:TrmH family RNA methyltransferase
VLDRVDRLPARPRDASAGESERNAGERSRCEPTILADSAFRALSGTDTPQGIAAEIELPARAPDLGASECCVFLDGVQDAGNVGAILRSAAALGVRDAVLGRGCADAWSPKVLRAAAGAHFVLRIAANADVLEALGRFGGTTACAVARGGTAPAAADLRGRIGWIFGAEGSGVRDSVAARADLKLTVPMPGRVESLNVAAAAAILLYERARQLSTRAARS